MVLILLATSGYFLYEEQRLEEKLVNVTHEAEMLNAEVPDPVIKYAPGLLFSAFSYLHSQRLVQDMYIAVFTQVT